MIALPFTGHVLVGFGHGRIHVDGAEDLVQPEAVLHRQHIFDEQFAGMVAHDRHAKDAVLTRRRQHLDEAQRRAAGDHPKMLM
jgi:hypothetical protein